MTDKEQIVLQEINRAVGRIEGKLEAMENTDKQILSSIANLDKRVGSLEGWKKWMNGAQAVILALLFWVFK